MRFLARRRWLVCGLAGLALTVTRASSASTHVFFSPGATPIAGEPFEVNLHYVDRCGWPGTFSTDQVHADAVGPDANRVFRVSWGVPGGIGCTEEPPATNVVVPVGLGPVPAGHYRVEVRDEVDDRLVAELLVEVFDRPACVPSETSLCLAGGRFGAAVSWRDFAGNQGAGHAVPRDPAVPFRADTGFVWFFSPDNYELMIKVLDGCALNGHYWVFISPGSTVEYSIEVTDHLAGLTRTYANPAGAVPRLFADTSAFPCR